MVEVGALSHTHATTVLFVELYLFYPPSLRVYLMKTKFGLLCDHVTLCQFLYVDNVFLTQITKLELS
jgi:hypothetical protein